MASRNETPTQDGPSLQQRLSAARASEHEAEQVLGGIKTRMRVAVEQQRYADAEQERLALPDAEHAWAVAKIELGTVEGTIAELDRRRAEHEAQLAAQKRKDAALGNLNRAAERARTLTDTLAQVKAELVAGIGAIQQTITRGYELEAAVRQAIAEQYRARVDAGEADGVPGHISGPNPISAFVESSAALLAIKNGTALP